MLLSRARAESKVVTTLSFIASSLERLISLQVPARIVDTIFACISVSSNCSFIHFAPSFLWFPLVCSQSLLSSRMPHFSLAVLCVRDSSAITPLSWSWSLLSLESSLLHELAGFRLLLSSACAGLVTFSSGSVLLPTGAVDAIEGMSSVALQPSVSIISDPIVPTSSIDSDLSLFSSSSSCSNLEKSRCSSNLACFNLAINVVGESAAIRWFF